MSAARMLRAALVQHPCGADPEENLARSIAGIETAAEGGAELVVLQELHRTRYFCQSQNPEHFDFAEPIPGPASERLAQAARANKVVLVASLFERRAAGLYHNTAVVFETDGGIAGKYRKMHIPDDPGFQEKFYFTPGDLGFTPIDTSAGRLGVLVCWDQWYPEAARLMALAGAEVLIYPTAIGWDPSDPEDERARQRDAWILAQRGHAVSNVMPVLAVNRVGHEPGHLPGAKGITFWGASFAAGPQGEILAMAPEDDAAVLIAGIDLGRTETLRRIWPFLRDRRIDAYGPLTRRYIDTD